MKTRGIVSMPHPPYSLDLALSNFYLFFTVKERIEHAGITGDDQLFEEPDNSKVDAGGELNRGFDPWRGRIQKINQGDGNYRSQ
jgi:hypothetical protein